MALDSSLAEIATALCQSVHALRLQVLVYNRPEDLDALIDTANSALLMASSLPRDQEREIRSILVQALSVKHGLVSEFKSRNTEEKIEVLEWKLSEGGGDAHGRLQILQDLILLIVSNDEDMKISTVERAIAYINEWVKVAPGCPDGDEDWGHVMQVAGKMLHMRFLHDEKEDDINRAVDYSKAAYEAPGFEELWQRPIVLRQYVLALKDRFTAKGNPADIKKAIELADAGMKRLSSDQPAYAVLMVSWLSSHDAKYLVSLDEEELNNAIKKGEDSLLAKGLLVDGLPEDELRLGIANLLFHRYRMNHNIEDLDRAIEHGLRAVELSPKEYNTSGNLSSFLALRVQRKHNLQDLKDAIYHSRIAVKHCDWGKMRLTCLFNLGYCLHEMYWQDKTRPIQILNESIDRLKEATKMTTRDNMARENGLNLLARSLGTRFLQSPIENVEDADAAIEILKEALDLRVTDGRLRGNVLRNLGTAYEERSKIRTSSRVSDKEQALKMFLQCWEYRNADVASRVEAGRSAARLLGECEDGGSYHEDDSKTRWNKAAKILEECVDMIPQLSTLAVQDEDKQQVLTQTSGLASDCAAAMLKAGRGSKFEILRRLELGRYVMATLSLEKTIELSALRQHKPHLADEYEKARAKLNTFAAPLGIQPRDTSSPLEIAKDKRRLEIEQEYYRICNLIRDEKGFDYFLEAPSESEMKAAAGNGTIVVINLNKTRSDAFLIDRSEIRCVRLKNLTQSKATEMLVRIYRDSLPAVLEWLWEALALPILKKMGIHGPPNKPGEWPRIWWVPTGLLTIAPLHAAGIHYLGSKDTVLDRAMSSYSTSVKSIIFARRSQAYLSSTSNSNNSQPTDGEKIEAGVAAPHEALLVSMAYTPGLNEPYLSKADDEIAAVEKELSAVEELASHSLQKRLQVNSTRLKTKRRDECLKMLRHCTMFHFAGHGKVDSKVPSQSALLLEDWDRQRMTMADLRDNHESSTLKSGATTESDETEGNMPAAPPFLAYLSACSTGAIRHAKLLDESIHLASGMQLAGFRHVIGTLWEVSDWHCVQVAKKFYATLLQLPLKHGDEGKNKQRQEGIEEAEAETEAKGRSHSDILDDHVCRALHKAVLALRDGKFVSQLASIRGDEQNLDAAISDDINTVPDGNGDEGEHDLDNVERNLAVVSVEDENVPGKEQESLDGTESMRHGGSVRRFPGSRRPAAVAIPYYWASYVHFGV